MVRKLQSLAVKIKLQRGQHWVPPAPELLPFPWHLASSHHAWSAKPWSPVLAGVASWVPSPALQTRDLPCAAGGAFRAAAPKVESAHRNITRAREKSTLGIRDRGAIGFGLPKLPRGRGRSSPPNARASRGRRAETTMYPRAAQPGYVCGRIVGGRRSRPQGKARDRAPLTADRGRRRATLASRRAAGS